MIELNKIYNENCLDLFKRIDNNSIDLIVTDPPYKIMRRGNAGNMGGFMTNNQSLKGKIFNNNDIEIKDYIKEFYRILKDGTIAYIMINNFNLQEMLNEATKVGFKFVKCLIWNKGNKICGRYYMNCFEYICLFRKGKDKPINDCGTPDILDVPIHKLKDKDGNNLHDTEKPVELMKILIKNSSNPGEIVLDPFSGIGSTLIASRDLKRNFIGCEIDEKYFKIAKRRIEEVKEQISIYDFMEE